MPSGSEEPEPLNVSDVSVCADWVGSRVRHRRLVRARRRRARRGSDRDPAPWHPRRKRDSSTGCRWSGRCGSMSSRSRS